MAGSLQSPAAGGERLMRFPIARKSISAGATFCAGFLTLSGSMTAMAATWQCAGDLAPEGHPDKSGFYLFESTTNVNEAGKGTLGFNLCTDTLCEIERHYHDLTCNNESPQREASCGETATDMAAQGSFSVELGPCRIEDSPAIDCATVKFLPRSTPVNRPAPVFIGTLECDRQD